MNTVRSWHAVALLLGVLAAPLCVALDAAEQDVDITMQIDNCPQNAEGIATRVKAILGPQFGAVDDAAALKQSLRALEILVLQAGHCSASAHSTKRNTAGRDDNIMEWHSMNQWLSRLTNVVYLNAKGDSERPWRDEYTLFAEVYEFEP